MLLSKHTIFINILVATNEEKRGEKMILNFKITNQHIERADNEMVVADSKNYLYAHFDFCTDEWKDITKSVNFIKGDEAYTIVLGDDCKALVPHEVIKEGVFEVSCFGGDLITNDTAKVRVSKSGYIEGIAPPEPTPDVYSAILKECKKTKDIAQHIEDARIDTFSIDESVITPDEDRNVNIALGENIEYKNGILNAKASKVEVWEEIYEETLSSNQQYVLIDTDMNGEPLDLSKAKIIFETGITTQNEQILIKISDKYSGTGKANGVACMSNTGAIATTKKYGLANLWIDGFVNASIAFAAYENVLSNISTSFNESITKIDKILIRLNNTNSIPAGTTFKVYGVKNG